MVDFGRFNLWICQQELIWYSLIKEKTGIWIIIAQVFQRSPDSSYNIFCGYLDSTRYGITKEKVHGNNREAISLWLGKCFCWNKLFQLTTTKYVTTMKSCCLLEYLVDPSQAWDMRRMSHTNKFNWTVCWVMPIKSLKLAKLSQGNFQNTSNFQIIWHSKFRYTLFYKHGVFLGQPLYAFDFCYFSFMLGHCCVKICSLSFLS